MFLEYGVGIATYFTLQEKLIKLFCMLTLLACIQMALFMHVGGLSLTNNETSSLHLFSFGNMGFSKAICAKSLVDFNRPLVQMSMQCERTTEPMEVLDAGILLSSALPEGTDDTLSICDSQHFEPGSVSHDLNMKYFDREVFTQDILTACY